MEEDIRIKIDKIYRPFKNRVLLRLFENKEKEIAPGVVIEVDTRWKRGIHQPRVGEVVRTPDKLVKTASGQAQTRWIPHMELMEGDIVWGVGIHFENEAKFVLGGDVFISVDYQNLVVAKRRSEITNLTDKNGEWEVIPLNGYVLIEPDEGGSDLLITKKKSANTGVIVYAGSSNLWYKNPDKEDSDVKAGDHVMFTRSYPLEEKMWASFHDGTIYQIIQKCEIILKLN